MKVKQKNGKLIFKKKVADKENQKESVSKTEESDCKICKNQVSHPSYCSHCGSKI